MDSLRPNDGEFHAGLRGFPRGVAVTVAGLARVARSGIVANDAGRLHVAIGPVVIVNRGLKPSLRQIAGQARRRRVQAIARAAEPTRISVPGSGTAPQLSEPSLSPEVNVIETASLPVWPEGTPFSSAPSGSAA